MTLVLQEMKVNFPGWHWIQVKPASWLYFSFPFFFFCSSVCVLTCPLPAPAVVCRWWSLSPVSSWCWAADCGAGAAWPVHPSLAPARSPDPGSPGRGPAVGRSTSSGSAEGSSPGPFPAGQGQKNGLLADSGTCDTWPNEMIFSRPHYCLKGFIFSYLFLITPFTFARFPVKDSLLFFFTLIVL